ncbi:MAG: TorF family putative porin [Woeseiaceae bacterium]
MDRTFKATTYILALPLLLTGGPALADWSANVGWASDYYFRGILQKSSSASGGVDFGQGGFYAGVWAADVGEGADSGLEVDGYFGYGGTIAEDFSYGVGFTGYYYTGDFDDTYQEINLSAGYGIVTFDVALGEYDNAGGPTQDYAFYSFTAEYNGFFGTYGVFDEDFDGSYIQAGYGTTIAEIDISFSALYSDDDLIGEADEALIFTIGKTFDF